MTVRNASNGRHDWAVMKNLDDQAGKSTDKFPPGKKDKLNENELEVRHRPNDNLALVLEKLNCLVDRMTNLEDGEEA